MSQNYPPSGNNEGYNGQQSGQESAGYYGGQPQGQQDQGQYGQGQYGQGQYSQSQYEQGQYGQGQYGQSQYGQGQYGSAAGGYPAQGGYGQQYGATPGGQPPDNFLVWAILSIFCCTPLGIAATIFSTKVNSKWAVGDANGAYDAAKKAKMFAIISIVVGIPIIILNFIVTLSRS